MKTLLIIDDEPGITDMVHAYFTKHGYEVLTAALTSEGADREQHIANALAIRALRHAIRKIPG